MKLATVTKLYYLSNEEHPDLFGVTVFLTFSFIWDQDKRTVVGGWRTKGLLEPETREYYLGNEEHTDLFVGPLV